MLNGYTCVCECIDVVFLSALWIVIRFLDIVLGVCSQSIFSFQQLFDGFVQGFGGLFLEPMKGVANKGAMGLVTVCMHACMFLCMYACMHVFMYVCMYVCIYVRIYACMHACIYVKGRS